MKNNRRNDPRIDTSNPDPTSGTAPTIVSQAFDYHALGALNNELAGIRDCAGPADRDVIQSAIDMLSFQFGGIRGLECRLNGDLATIPDSALRGVVLQHTGADPALFNAGLALARDVRLLCFFRTLSYEQPEGPSHDN
jgi:hypothetical protein